MFNPRINKGPMLRRKRRKTIDRLFFSLSIPKVAKKGIDEFASYRAIACLKSVLENPSLSLETISLCSSVEIKCA